MANAAEHWTDQPDEHDYPAAEDHISLLTPPPTARALGERLKTAELASQGKRPAARQPSPRPRPDNVPCRIVGAPRA